MSLYFLSVQFIGIRKKPDTFLNIDVKKLVEATKKNVRVKIFSSFTNKFIIFKHFEHFCMKKKGR